MSPIGHGGLLKMTKDDGPGGEAGGGHGGWGFEASGWRGAEENRARRRGTQTGSSTRLTQIFHLLVTGGAAEFAVSGPFAAALRAGGPCNTLQLLL